jgi:hypothetical protein
MTDLRTNNEKVDNAKAFLFSTIFKTNANAKGKIFKKSKQNQAKQAIYRDRDKLL